MSDQPDLEEKPQEAVLPTQAPAANEAAPALQTPGDQSSPEQKPLSRGVNLWGIILITVYEIAITILFGYVLLSFWPAEIAAAGSAGTPSTASIFGISVVIYNEVRILVLIGMIGAIGAQVRGLRSLYWYIGNRELRWSWVVMYLFLPFIGGILGLIFYFVIRAGFFSASANIQDANPVGFIALAALAGMFSEQAVLKLKDVAETLLTSPPSGKDAVPQEE